MRRAFAVPAVFLSRTKRVRTSGLRASSLAFTWWFGESAEAVVVRDPDRRRNRRRRFV